MRARIVIAVALAVPLALLACVGWYHLQQLEAQRMDVEAQVIVPTRMNTIRDLVFAYEQAHGRSPADWTDLGLDTREIAQLREDLLAITQAETLHVDWSVLARRDEAPEATFIGPIEADNYGSFARRKTGIDRVRMLANLEWVVERTGREDSRGGGL